MHTMICIYLAGEGRDHRQIDDECHSHCYTAIDGAVLDGLPNFSLVEPIYSPAQDQGAVQVLLTQQHTRQERKTSESGVSVGEVYKQAT